MIERIQTEKLPHGTICVAFTPDEEIGMGAEHFDLEQFGAEYAYTLDGDSEEKFSMRILMHARQSLKLEGLMYIRVKAKIQ